MTLFDAAEQIGGQFNIAKQIPGKEEFHETLRYFRRQLALREVTVRLGVNVEAADLSEFDEVILACGIVPRTPDIPGIGHAKVLSYLDVLRDKKPVGQRVAIVGAGGIGLVYAENMRLWNWDVVMFITLILVVVVMIMDKVSSMLRNKYIIGEDIPLYQQKSQID